MKPEMGRVGKMESASRVAAFLKAAEGAGEAEELGGLEIIRVPRGQQGIGADTLPKRDTPTVVVDMSLGVLEAQGREGLGDEGEEGKSTHQHMINTHLPRTRTS